MYDKQSKLNGYFCIGAKLKGNSLDNTTAMLFNDPYLVNSFRDELDQCISKLRNKFNVSINCSSIIVAFPHAYVLDSKCHPVLCKDNLFIAIFRVLGSTFKSDDGCEFRIGTLITPISSFINRYQILIKEKGSPVFEHHAAIIGPNSDRSKVERELRAAVRERNKSLNTST